MTDKELLQLIVFCFDTDNQEAIESIVEAYKENDGGFTELDAIETMQEMLRQIYALKIRDKKKCGTCSRSQGGYCLNREGTATQVLLRKDDYCSFWEKK